MRSPLKLTSLTGNQSLVGRILFVLFAIYALFTVGRGLWSNAQLIAEEEEIKQEISQLKAETARLKEEVTYQQSNTFKEKEARLKLGYKGPGETAVVVPETRAPRKDEPVVQFGGLPTDTRSNLEKWWDYFFPPR